MALQVGRSRLLEFLGDMPQTEFARRLEVTDGFISEVISGKKKFSYELAMNAAYILGCEMESLHEWIVVPSRKKRKRRRRE